MDGARERLLDNLLQRLGPAARAEGLGIARDLGLAGFNRTTAALCDAQGRVRLIVSVHGNDPTPGLNLVAQTPAPYLLTANCLTPVVELRIPAQLGLGHGASLATAQLPGNQFTPETLTLEVPAVTLDLADVYAGVLDLRPAPQRLRVEVELDLVSEAAVDVDRIRRTVLHMVGSAWRRGLLNEAGEVVTRLAVRVGTTDGRSGDTIVLTGQ